MRGLLRRYLEQRILFYQERDEANVAGINGETARTQNEMWSVVESVAAQQATPIIATVPAERGRPCW